MPENFTDKSNDELAARLAEIRETFNQDFAEASPEQIEQLETLADEAEAIKAELAKRTESKDKKEVVASLAAKVNQSVSISKIKVPEDTRPKPNRAF